MKSRYSSSRKSSKMKCIDNDLIKTIEKLQRWLQQEENKKYGKKAQKVTFNYSSKELNKLIKSFGRRRK